MTFNEFKHWLDGFCEAIEGAPTCDQWQRIRTVMESVSVSVPESIKIVLEKQPFFPSPVTIPIVNLPMPNTQFLPSWPNVTYCSSDRVSNDVSSPRMA